MSVLSKAFVCLIDDDADMRHALKQLLKSSGLPALAFANAEEFLAHGVQKDIGCLLLDVRMPGMGGLALLDALRQRHCYIPAILLTGYADVPVAVRAFRAGAFDLVEKPYRDEDLLERIRQALARHEQLRLFQAERLEAFQRLEKLSPREVQVLDRMVAGASNRRIAEELTISVKTLDIHRANIFRKMQTKSIADLVRWRLITKVDPFGTRSLESVPLTP